MSFRHRKLFVAAALALFASAPVFATEAVSGKVVADTAGCNKCHAADAKKMGPSYKAIAAKHAGKDSARADLVAKLKAGSGHPKTTASDADLAAVMTWVLAQK